MASEATEILQAIASGDRSEVDKLMGLVYDDLRGLAHSKLGGDTPENSLNPTAVVHEVFIKLVDKRIDWRGKSHFFAVCAQSMRHILVDYARHNSAQKRGGGRHRIPLADDVALSPQHDEDVLALDEALNALAEIDQQRALIVELRFFGGMTVKEVGEALGIAERTVGQQWATVRLWLRKYLTENGTQDNLNS
jgi:RNA polymerase sigma-70 factor (ECF subfamily)